MSTSTAARRYAKALLELSDEAGELEQVGKNLDEVVATWNANKTLRDVFENPSVGSHQRRSVLTAICERMRVSSLLQNTLLLLADRRRLGVLPQIAEAYRQLAQKRSGQVQAQVITAGPMPERYFEELRRTLESVTGKTVTIDRKQDATLIGGVITRIGDKVFDGSLKNQLQELKEELLAR